jgi:bifunctional ADP-heptose synthase (sugar kinase/adenylyltransferase)
MSRDPVAQKLSTILESLSDITVTLVADFLGTGSNSGGVPVALRLAELGVTVFPVGVVGEDEAGQQIFHALHEYRISTGGINKLKTYATPMDGSKELIHGEHPALLNLIENARKFAAASEAVYLCDYGLGAATPRLLNFIKSNRSLKDKTLAARSRNRITDFEQLTTAIATEGEIERAIGLELGGDPKKMAVAGKGVIEELGLESLLVVGSSEVMAFSGSHKPVPIALGGSTVPEQIDVLGAIFVAALATGAETADAAQLAVQVTGFLANRQGQAKRVRREELIASLAIPKAASRIR